MFVSFQVIMLLDRIVLQHGCRSMRMYVLSMIKLSLTEAGAHLSIASPSKPDHHGQRLMAR